jgi:RimJ/RimL family protein N-acetyltransferase
MDEWKYQTDEVVLSPYVDGQAEWPDDFLVSIYRMMKQDGTLEVVFPGITDLTLNGFVGYLKDKPLLTCVRKSDMNVMGFAFLWGIEGEKPHRKASLGFVYFKPFWGTSLIRQTSRLALQWWFNELGIEVLYGATLKSNRLARRFAAELGFLKMGDMPMFFWNSSHQELKDAVLLCLTRNAWAMRGEHGWPVTEYRQRAEHGSQRAS